MSRLDPEKSNLIDAMNKYAESLDRALAAAQALIKSIDDARKAAR